MMRQPLDFDLGELNYTCSTYLFQNFARAGIALMWAKEALGPKGGAVFFYYDGHSTCLRVMPNAPNSSKQRCVVTLSRMTTRCWDAN